MEYLLIIGEWGSVYISAPAGPSKMIAGREPRSGGEDAERDIQPKDEHPMELIFSKDGVDYAFPVVDPIQSTSARHTVHLDYEEAAEKVRGPLTLRGCTAEKDEKTGVLLRIRLELVPFDSRSGAPVGSTPRPPTTGLSGAEPVVSRGPAGLDLAAIERQAPPWRIPFIRRAVQARGRTLVDEIRMIVKARGKISRADLDHELTARGYSAFAGGFYASMSVLRDDFGEIRQTGRGDYATYEWVGDNAPELTLPGVTYSNQLPSKGKPSGHRKFVYLGHQIRAFRFKGRETKVRTYKDMLLTIARALAEENPENVRKLATLQGTKRQYFSTSEGDITGVRTKIDEVGLFVETNLSADYIVKICRMALAATGHAPNELEVVADGVTENDNGGL